MKLHAKVRAVEKVFQQLDKDLASFKNSTGLHCLTGCGLCCKKPDIAATPLEFLPLAYYLFKQNLAYQWLDAIKADPAYTICKAFKPFLGKDDRGFCNYYEWRGLICRLFGFSANLNKHGEPRLSTCQVIKTELSEAYHKANQFVEAGNSVPVMRNYYFKLRTIDPDLGQRLEPINEAIKHAIETVLAYYAYRRPRRA